MNEQETIKNELIIGVMNNLRAAVKKAVKDTETIMKMAESEEKTYPHGFDPEGEWLAEMSGDTGKYRPVKRTNQIKWLYARMGNVFHAEEEAARRSEGLNAHMDLVIAIHDGNHLYPDSGGYLTFLTSAKFGFTYTPDQLYAPPSLRMVGEKSFVYVVEKLGEKQIKRALEWGM